MFKSEIHSIKFSRFHMMLEQTRRQTKKGIEPTFDFRLRKKRNMEHRKSVRTKGEFYLNGFKYTKIVNFYTTFSKQHQL